MSDVATLSRLAPAVSQLPVDWYFDEKIFELEKKLIFDAGPGYVGHQLMVPEAMDYRSLEWRDHGQLLLNGVAVTAGQNIAAGSLGQLTYVPAANANGNGLGGFTFQVRIGGQNNFSHHTISKPHH